MFVLSVTGIMDAMKKPAGAAGKGKGASLKSQTRKNQADFALFAMISIICTSVCCIERLASAQRLAMD